MAHRVPAALETETSHFITHLLWQMTGLMLMGMALFKLGVLSATRSRRFYLTTGSLGFGLGGVLVSLGLWRSYLTNWDLLDFVLISQQLQYWGNLLVALGWTALVMLLVQLGWRLQILATVGRMALTNYLLQSVICTMVFYGHGPSGCSSGSHPRYGYVTSPWARSSGSCGSWSSGGGQASCVRLP
jgi:uncharacterized protein